MNDTGVLCFTKPFLLIVCVDLDSKDCDMRSINYYFLLSGGHIIVLRSEELLCVITQTYHGNRTLVELIMLLHHCQKQNDQIFTQFEGESHITLQ